MVPTSPRAAWLALSAAFAVLGSVAVRLPAASAASLPDTPPVATVAAHVRAQYRRPASVPFPAENAPSAARVTLGKTLFFDPRLSGTRDISCATCHMPDRGWEDGRARAVGTRAQQLARHTPTVLNTAYAAALFWDGRAATLEEQALGPVQASGEMDMHLDTLRTRLSAIPGYRTLFARAYPGQPISGALVASAIANFERTLVSGPAPFDRWIEGDSTAISASAQRGFAVFTGKAQCTQCHSGWRLTDDSFHDIGVAGTDSGRARILPGIESMEFAFKTPTLRDLARRAPYMHDGSEATLADVIEFYDQGGRTRRPSLAAEITPLHLTTTEKRDLLAFLGTLDGRTPVVQAPRLPR